jgi:hypothetical protein
MNAFEERPESIDAANIDRLIDGELPELERRALLLRLEADPEGWRRCSLAFLEDQAWRRALTAAIPADLAPSPASLSGSPVQVSGRTGWLRRSSIAATLMASTFGAGFAAGGLAKDGTRPEVAREVNVGPDKVPMPPPAAEVREVGRLRVVDDSTGEGPARSFPIRSGPGLDDRWLRSQPPSVPDYVRARYERQGYQVAERRKVMSVELENGRRVSIPVDEVEVDYVGQQPL